jgi:hypothetical protein
VRRWLQRHEHVTVTARRMRPRLWMYYLEAMP